MASCHDQELATMDERHGRILDLLVKLGREMKETTSLLTRMMTPSEMEEDSTVTTTEETLDDIRDAQLHLDAEPDAHLHPVVVPSAQIHHDVVPPPTTTEEILVAVAEMQLHLVGHDKLVPIVERAGHAPVVISFRAEHKLALVCRVFDELPSPGNYIVVEQGMSLDMATALILDRKEEHMPACFTVESLHLVILLVSLRAYGVWRIPCHLCICARLYAARCACESTGVWRPPWPPPTVEQLLLLAWYVSEGEVVSGMQDYSVKWFV